MNKYVVITGASSGIGYSTAKAFANRGKNLILLARRLDNLERVRKEILDEHPSLDVIIHQVDLMDSENCHRIYKDLSSYCLETWINNAGIGVYGTVAEHEISSIETMLQTNITALTILSSLFIRDYKDIDDTQLINISSAGGYTIVQNAVMYCASKFYVSAFTEGLSLELSNSGAKMKVKLLAPFLTETEFAKVANNVSRFSYQEKYQKYHTSDEVAGLLLQLYDSDKTVGIVSREDFSFSLSEPLFNHSGPS